MSRILLFIFVLGTALNAAPPKWPEPPTGFSWVNFDAARCAVLKPNGWHLKWETNGKTAAMFISKETIETAGRFQTGLTVNFIAKVKKSTGLKSSKYAQAFLGQAEQKHPQPLKKAFTVKLGKNINGFGLRVKLEESPTQIVHYFLIADDNEDSLTLMIFEAPNSSWNSDWLLGEKMLNGQLWRD